MGRKVFVVGVGMTKFEKPFSRDWSYVDMAKQAATAALSDAGVAYADVQQACVGYVFGDSTRGQRALYGVGLTGIPVYNVNNNCATGSTALFMGKQLIEGGMADCVLALGFEQMAKGAIAMDRSQAGALWAHYDRLRELRGQAESPPAAQFFGAAGQEHMERWGTTVEQFAKVAVKNHRHSVHNPNSQFRGECSLEEVLRSPVVHQPLTRLQCCPTSDGAAAAVLASAEFVEEHGLERRAVEIAGMAMATDLPSTFEDGPIRLCGADMTARAAARAYRESGLGPENVQVVELHDCFSTNELITYEALGLCPEGRGGELIDSGAVTYGGRWVVNPSGGLISKGHPLGATGLAQCAELAWQMRGEAGERQVPGARAALQHNLGLGGAVVVTVYRAPASA